MNYVKPIQFPWCAVMALAIAFLLTGCGPEAHVRGPSSVTRTTLKALKLAATEYEVETNVMIDQTDPRWSARQKKNAPGAVGTGLIDDSIERLVYALLEVEQSKRIVMYLDKGALIDSDGDGFLEVVDGWGNKLVYDTDVSHSDADTSDDFLPERKGPDPFIVSAGHGEEFGNVKENPQDPAAKDNIYSFNLGQ